MINNHLAAKDGCAFGVVVNRLRNFFLRRNFQEVHTQDRLSILAACEDPTTIATYFYAGHHWPLPQTGQMWLEYELLSQSDLPGVFCVSTSYRQEQNPVPGRHELVFPMFEFESRGTLEDLRWLEIELCEELGFGQRSGFCHRSYEETARYYSTREITSEHEQKICRDFGPVYFLERFPLHTSPFWNMRKEGEYAHKIDVILYGMETIGSAERSVNPQEMREQFYTISGGRYAGILFDHFGQERVKKELEDFLSLDFFPRFGGGIGMTRMIKALGAAGFL